MLSAAELRARQTKLLGEQQAAIHREKARLEKELRLKEQKEQRERQREEEQRQRHLQELAAAQKAEAEAEAELEHNRGVALHAVLQAIDADDTASQSRGIKRSADKVLLPASMSQALMAQDAGKNGALLFELTSHATGRRTHAGVLSFSTPDGVVGLPMKVRQCLFGHGGAAHGMVAMRYRRLDKGSFVRFQPLSRGFHEAVGDDVRGVLEQCLSRYSALTVGDVVSLELGGAAFDLRVVELQPADAVSIIDTDMEAEVVASAETEALVREWEEQQRRNAEQLAAARAAREAAQRAQEEAAMAEAAEQKRLQEAAQAAAQQALADRLAHQAAREAALGPEPSASCGQPTVLCAVRLPDGVRISRRFLQTAPAQQLFAWVDAKGAGGISGDYDLVTQFPRRRVTRPMPQPHGVHAPKAPAAENTPLSSLEQPEQAEQGPQRTPEVLPVGPGMHVGQGTGSVQMWPDASSGEVASSSWTLEEWGLGKADGQELFLLEPKEAQV